LNLPDQPGVSSLSLATHNRHQTVTNNNEGPHRDDDDDD
jgi:hypothetical protein